jgi:cell division protein ZapE
MKEVRDPMPAGRPRTLREQYLRQLAARRAESDAGQLAVLARLERLRTALGNGTKGGRLPRWLGRWTRRAAPPAPRGIYLWGEVGRGKTWLMDLFFESLPFPDKLRAHFHHFMREIHARLRALDGTADPLEQLAAALAERARVICLDELFVSDITDAMLLGGLFGALLDHGVTLVITSNVAPADLYRDGLQRVRFLPAIGLLESRLEVLALHGEIDYRLRHLRQAPIYLSTADPQRAQESLEALFERLAGQQGESERRLQIGGRLLCAYRRRGAVVWFKFATLCEGARSTSDYVEIASQFRTVLVSDIPVLTHDDEDAARRLIALVDEFYDRGVKLVVSAARPPAELYQGERLQQEFLRTASRLVEMQSEEYLARAHRL